MIREDWERILQNTEVRQSLSRLKKDIKERDNKEQLLHNISGQEMILTDLLHSDDAKTRKNAALLMGELGHQGFLPHIYEAYRQEEQRFVRSSYLAAMANLDYRAYTRELKERLEELQHIKLTIENEKHLMEEMRELSSLIIRMDGVKKHGFVGWSEASDIILITNRNFPANTRDELERLESKAKSKLFTAGVMARVAHLKWVGDIRTYHELLFVIDGMKTCPTEPSEAANIIAGSGLLKFMGSMHDGEAPYYFRVELKGRKELDEKSVFLKKLSGQIEKQSQRKLINTTDNYEFEIRMIENKEGGYNLLVKLFTLKDDRFSYRREVTPTSIRPFYAALTVNLAKDYLREGAQVLDPFCGVGTMLIERHKAVRAKTMYGVDIQEDAIIKARKNTEAAGQSVYYVNRDFFKFQHEYLFDEVITDMPFAIGHISLEEITILYRQFFARVVKHLKPDAVLVLYSHNRELLKPLAARAGFSVLDEFEISKREGTYVFVLRKESV